MAGRAWLRRGIGIGVAFLFAEWHSSAPFGVERHGTSEVLLGLRQTTAQHEG